MRTEMIMENERVGLRQITLHYRRFTEDYDGWGLHVWGPTPEHVTWESPLYPNTFLPLILVGKRTPNNNILLAFDGSENAASAVDFVGSLLGGLDYEVSLFHVIRSNGEGLPEHQHILSPKEYSKFARKEMASSLKAARTELINADFKANKVSTQMATRAISRAGAIADKAKQENFGTIVMGRRGHSRVRDFFIGRVTNKVIHMARDRTVWVIR